MLQAKINQCSLSNMMYLTDVTSIEQNIVNDISQRYDRAKVYASFKILLFIHVSV